MAMEGCKNKKSTCDCQSCAKSMIYNGRCVHCLCCIYGERAMENCDTWVENNRE